MAFHWDPALREREGEESVTAVPAFSRSLNGALTEGAEGPGSGVPAADGGGKDPSLDTGKLTSAPSVSALSGEEPWRIGVLLGSHPCASVPATGPGASSPLSALTGAERGVGGPPHTEVGVGTGWAATVWKCNISAPVSAPTEGNGGPDGGFESRGTFPSVSALDDAAAPQPAGALHRPCFPDRGSGEGSPAAIDDDTSLGRVAASSSAPALSPGVELSRLPLWGALPFMAVLDAVRTRP